MSVGIYHLWGKCDVFIFLLSIGSATFLTGHTTTQYCSFVDFWHIIFMAGHHQIPLSDFHRVMKACEHHQSPGFLTSNTKEDAICQEALKRIKTEMVRITMKRPFFEFLLLIVPNENMTVVTGRILYL